MAFSRKQIRSWMIIALLVFIIAVQGLMTFFIVDNPEVTAWDFRPVPDVPGQSPYAIYEKLPYGQHIKGAKGE